MDTAAPCNVHYSKFSQEPMIAPNPSSRHTVHNGIDQREYAVGIKIATAKRESEICHELYHATFLYVFNDALKKSVYYSSVYRSAIPPDTIVVAVVANES